MWDWKEIFKDLLIKIDKYKNTKKSKVIFNLSRKMIFNYLLWTNKEMTLFFLDDIDNKDKSFKTLQKWMEYILKIERGEI